MKPKILENTIRFPLWNSVLLLLNEPKQHHVDLCESKKWSENLVYVKEQIPALLVSGRFPRAIVNVE